MRRCKIPPTACARIKSAPCCVDCPKPQCRARCLNDPAWCNCWEDKPSKPPKRVGKVDPFQVAWLYSQGQTQREIAAQLGCGKSTVYQILAETGVTGRG